MRHFRKSALIIISMVLFLGATSCAAEDVVNKPKPKSRNQSKEKKVNDFQVKMSAPNKIDKDNRRAKLVLEVKNVSDKDIEVTYGSPRKYDFEVVDASGKSVWCATCDKVYIQMIETDGIAAGATVTFSAVWEGTDNGGKTLEAGIYTVRGSWLVLEHRSQLEQKIEIAE